MRWERRSPPIEQGEISPLALKRATQRTALAMLTPKRLAAALRDMPPSTAPTTRSRRSTESAIPAASCARRQSSSRSKLIRESIPRFNSLGDRSSARRHEFEEWDIKLNSARSVAEIMIVESRAAASYWRNFRDAGLRERKNGNLPRSSLRFAQRNKGAAFLGNQHASHPINAMLNYCYIVEAGRLAKALAAQGLCLSIGYLHSDKKGRNSLVWDAIEPLRPVIDAEVFEFIE